MLNQFYFTPMQVVLIGGDYVCSVQHNDCNYISSSIDYVIAVDAMTILPINILNKDKLPAKNVYQYDNGAIRHITATDGKIKNCSEAMNLATFVQDILRKHRFVLHVYSGSSNIRAINVITDCKVNCHVVDKQQKLEDNWSELAIAVDDSQAMSSNIKLSATKVQFSTEALIDAIDMLKTMTYELANKQGKYDGSPGIAPLLMHTIGECNEAHVAFASNNRANAIDVNELMTMLDNHDKDEIYVKYFKAAVKSTFEDELADIALMVLSIAGYYDVDIAKHILLKQKYNELRNEHSAINDYKK